MKISLHPPKKSLSKAFLKQRPYKHSIDKFKKNLLTLLEKIDEIEREENQKNHILNFLRDTYYKDVYEINTKDVKDLVIHTGKSNKDSVGVIIETKRPGNKGEMISADKVNVKSFQELVLYYLHERVEENNIDIKNCIITNIYEWFIFDASYFEKYFYRNKNFVKQYEEWRKGQKVTSDTTLFYNDIAKPYIDSIEDEIPVTYFDIRKYESSIKSNDDEQNRTLIALYKLLSPTHLLRIPFADDSNKLDEKFYKELLHIIGLEEVKEGSKHIIRRKEEDKRDAGSLLENAITKLKIMDSADRVSDSSSFGDTKDDKNFNIALELCITWINRILFLKLLEAQLLNYHNGNSDYKFLNKDKLKDFDEVFSLFHHVLAVPSPERDKDVKKKFEFVPYLNSTLFEISPLERETINISSLNDSLSLDLIKNTVLKDLKKGTTSLPAIEYILKFLDAFDFASEGTEDVQEENKTLINASVLGKVFEKINGYKDGSIFTPGFITMYMCREAIRPAVVQKFKDKYNWKAENFDDLKNFIVDKRSREDIVEFNELINSLRICDPAVGSGHFLVSSLNELIAIKSELGIFSDENGSRIPDYDITIEQDELIITDKNGDFFEYKVNASSSGKEFKVRADIQKLQQTLFHEKQKIIENCLFGVDINPNSVKICRLRLWIELLKNAYYKTLGPPPSPLLFKEGEHSNALIGKTGEVSNELETLPNIDINIKNGNSLISRFPLVSNLSKFGQKTKDIINEYKISVSEYKNEKDRVKKNKINDLIGSLKNDIRTTISKNDPKVVRLAKLKGELENLETQTDLFEPSKKELKEKETSKKKLTAEIAKLNKEVEDIRSNAIYKNAFEWRFEFPEVLNGDGEYVGFDVVISNPPYIRQEAIIPIKEYLKEKYKVFISSGDIFFYFYETSYNILKNSGKLAFINNTFDKTTAGKILRQYITSNFELLKYIDFTSVVVFEEATTYPIILIASKTNSTKPFQYYKFNKTSYTAKELIYDENIFTKIKQETLNSNAWNFLENNGADLLNKVRQHKPLSEIYGKSYRGVMTGMNEAFIIDNKTKEKILSESSNDIEIIKPLFEGKDLKKWLSLSVDKWIIFTKRGIDIEKYPAVLNHLSEYKNLLEPKPKHQVGDWAGRKPGAYKWYELQDSTDYYLNFEKPKITWPNLQSENKFSFEIEGRYINAPSVILPVYDKYLLAILNSKIVWHFLKSICVIRSGGYIEVKPQYVEQIPIPEIPEKEKQPFSGLVDEILELKKQGKDSSALEAEIDRMVYALYGLTEEEIGIVEGK